MSEFYFINQQIVIAEKKAVLDSIQSDVPIDPVDVLTGAKLNPEPSKIDITLADSSGEPSKARVDSGSELGAGKPIRRIWRFWSSTTDSLHYVQCFAELF